MRAIVTCCLHACLLSVRATLEPALLLQVPALQHHAVYDSSGAAVLLAAGVCSEALCRCNKAALPTVYVGNVWLKYFGSTQATCRFSGTQPVETGSQLLVGLHVACSAEVQACAALPLWIAAL
jgi:hypothetical protein